MIRRFQIVVFLFLCLSFSEVFTVHAYLDTPVPLEPVDNARFGRDNPSVTFSWSWTDAYYYKIEFAVDEAFEVSTGPIRVDSLSYDIYSLIPADMWDSLEITLYWRVCATYLQLGIFEIDSFWSAPQVLYKSTLTSPLLLSPADDARFSSTTGLPFFQWTSPDNTPRFQIEFASSPSFYFSYGIADIEGTTIDLSGIDRSDWDPIEGIYYWRVSAVTDNGTPGPWSEAFHFSKTTIDAPQIAWPADGTRFPPQSHVPFLEWHPLDTGSDDYQIRFTLDREGQQLIGVMDITGTRLDLADYMSDRDWWYVYANFFWSVAGFDAAGRPGPWSPPAELTKVGWHRISAFGDSITYGECVPNGYLDMLAERLAARWGDVSTINQSVPGTKAKWGEDTIEAALTNACPQFILILFGANDAVDPGNCDPPYGCDVEGHLAAMVQIARSRGTTPIISTVLPVNPEGDFAGAQWRVDMYNDAIRDMAADINAPFVDLNQMFWDFGDDITPLFCDWGHPSYEGYEIMADGFYQGIVSHGG